MAQQVVIIGGGVAGLGAANALADRGILSTVVEAQQVGRHKVTGEFFSCESLSLLERWGISYTLIRQILLQTNHQAYFFHFGSQPAGSVSVVSCEQHLAKRARRLGVLFYEQVSVDKIVRLPFERYCLQLSNGMQLDADILLIAAGRYPIIESVGDALQGQNMQHVCYTAGSHKRMPQYIGFKAYYKHLHEQRDQLEFYLSTGAYWGVSAIDADTTNITCLVPYQLVQRFARPADCLHWLFAQYSQFYRRFLSKPCLFDSWLTAPVYNFGKKPMPWYEHVLYIGDAAATIHPVSGNGLSMALGSAVLATDAIAAYNAACVDGYSGESVAHIFHRLWYEAYNSRLYWAKVLHNIFIRPALCDIGLCLARLMPDLALFLYRNTRKK